MLVLRNKVVKSALQVITYCHITWLQLYAKQTSFFFCPVAKKANV